MRLELPSVESVTDERTGAELCRAGGSSNRDMPGTIFMMTVHTNDDKIRVETTVEDITGSVADQYEKSKGRETRGMNIYHRIALTDKYTTKFGKTFLVWSFEVNREIDGQKLIELRDLFIKLFFDRSSSYKYNSDDMQSSEGFYTDELRFLPYHVDKRFYCTVKAGAAR